MLTHKKDIDAKSNIFLLENFKYIAETCDMNIKSHRKQQYGSLVKYEVEAYASCVAFALTNTKLQF